ncbi:MAG: bifunctional proline dehydrogenase/L-glutamate gamma-semialdehyde dehydrogenase PutA [Sulfuricella sp.]|nr:bifunctional proline dehydrogenase/L-glutamate gamma-semialdehyde dehydrogenase PutA [Sulfuricella sp.]
MNAAPTLPTLRAAIGAAHLADETACVERLLREARLDDPLQRRIGDDALRLAAAARAHPSSALADAFLHEYDLSSEEGVLLMCLAEALLRIPDAATADRLIHDKLAHGQWLHHLGHSPSALVNASTWGLLFTGKLIEPHGDAGTRMERLAARIGESAARVALKQAMALLAGHFVFARTIEEALQTTLHDEYRANAHGESPPQTMKRRGATTVSLTPNPLPQTGEGDEVSLREFRVNRFSFDMLGEAALTAADAEEHFAAYAYAIRAIAMAAGGGPGISVKLSALHPRFEHAQRERVLAELVPRLTELAQLAAAANIGLTVDAEEADRLEITLDVFEAACRRIQPTAWNGLGLAVQAYQKRAPAVLDWLGALAEELGGPLPVRLVKGAYWDSEIKRAQAQGLAGYPVYTRKSATDVSYLACARRLLARPDLFYPMFATHNAHAVAYVLAVAGDGADFEFQRLHGMGATLYAEIDKSRPCRVYAPVGGHRELLPYLVRRLLENGANTSFINRLADPAVPLAAVVADPAATLAAHAAKPNPRIPLPAALYGEARRNSAGLSLADPAALTALADAMERAWAQDWRAAPVVGGKILAGVERRVADPSDRRRTAGSVIEADEAALERALALAAAAAPGWDATPAETRAACLDRAADLFEARRAELMALCVREGGKCIPDALAEVREAVDYCRYYAHLARRDFAAPLLLPGPAGECNTLALHGRGVFACISPWNFPLAIFTGQVAAALAAGNAAIAKPASQTPLVAAKAVRLLLEAGIPPDILHFLPGAGGTLGMKLIADARIAGVAFTGSTETAHRIQLALAARPGAIVPFIAETGGQNALIADSSALPEQVVGDAIQSAFNSAGQRCSALRVLFVQEEIAPRVLDMLSGAMAELRVGDPARLATDVGPVIDDNALAMLERHVEFLETHGRPIGRAPLSAETGHGSFFAPCAYEIPDLGLLEHEVFGPILHVVRFGADELDRVAAAINRTGYGLTCGIHSRIGETVDFLQNRLYVGNLYVNRNMIGAVVGVQPFGGEGLSGTGPKAGGPFYLHRFALERAVAVNTAAVGGNASLLSSGEDGTD